ncbi:MerR family transcriptional regulator [Subtercola vilae]|uniref:MerR family transcriptional regulator n=1 Tax=Subtercola vilae TaxID=2056433 RepID=A0A4T2BE59_9MICO|nr:MerR family transcriptional regulator [Subtercola vilae]TIH29495.1 MerR family transcriptional regulator [Subtercola vilae]
MMHIGELAERTSLSLRTIRHYDEVGLMKPSGRTDGGFRLYTEEDLSRLLLIRRMKPLGFSLEEMSELLRVIDALDQGDDADLRAQLAGFIDRATEQRDKLQRQLDMADEFVELLRTKQ